MNDEPKPTKDKRRENRRRTRLNSGILRLPNGTPLTDCLILDRSSQGARLLLLQPLLLPIDLVLEDETAGTFFRARIVRRNKTELGVKITPIRSGVYAPFTSEVSRLVKQPPKD